MLLKVRPFKHTARRLRAYGGAQAASRMLPTQATRHRVTCAVFSCGTGQTLAVHPTPSAGRSSRMVVAMGRKIRPHSWENVGVLKGLALKGSGFQGFADMVVILRASC